jgi:hypothetical protein
MARAKFCVFFQMSESSPETVTETKENNPVPKVRFIFMISLTQLG